MVNSIDSNAPIARDPRERPAYTDRANVLPSSLQVSVVTYRPDRALLERTLYRLAQAIAVAREAGVIRTVNVALIDNSGDRENADAVVNLGRARFADTGVQLICLAGHANIGFGAAHNLVLHGSGANYHLVLNPDVELDREALMIGVRWLDAHPDIGALAPQVSTPNGKRDYLCKRYPSVLDLALRGFTPTLGRAFFRQRMARYEMRDVIDPTPDREVIDIPAMSGAVLLVRRKAIDTSGGFDPGFFLYFEDFDWTVRLNRITRTAYVPSVKVVHHGGGAARKGVRHIGWFIKSGFRFYRTHGWRWI